jgi:hypothetical protein
VKVLFCLGGSTPSLYVQNTSDTISDESYFWSSLSATSELGWNVSSQTRVCVRPRQPGRARTRTHVPACNDTFFGLWNAGFLSTAVPGRPEGRAGSTGSCM